MKYSNSLGYLPVDLGKKQEYSIEFKDAKLVTDPWTEDEWWTEQCSFITQDNVAMSSNF